MHVRMSSGSGSGATRVGPKQLQGYLLEHGTNQATLAVTGNVHFRRKRWFVFSPHNGILYSYRTSEDLFPINEIDISSASFRIKSSSCNSFQFEIVSGCKHLVLESSSSADGFNWIRTFQQYRHNYFNQCECRTGPPLTSPTDPLIGRSGPRRSPVTFHFSTKAGLSRLTRFR